MDPLGHLHSSNPEATETLGAALAALLVPGHVVGLVGDLGAGKTCFARGVAHGLQVPAQEPVASPTFTLVNEHHGRCTLFHLDLYRLATLEEMEEIGLDEMLGGEGVCLIEWFEKYPYETLRECLVVHLAATGESQRQLTVYATGPEHRALARRWIELADLAK